MLSTDDQLVASAVSWAIKVPPRASEYRVDVPGSDRRDAILAAAAAEAGLIQRGTRLLRAGEANTPEPVHITVQRPQPAAASAVPEFRVPFAFAVGGVEPTQCVVRIKLGGDAPRSWVYASEGEDRCWPRPGSFPNR